MTAALAFAWVRALLRSLPREAYYALAVVAVLWWVRHDGVRAGRGQCEAAHVLADRRAAVAAQAVASRRQAARDTADAVGAARAAELAATAQNERVIIREVYRNAPDRDRVCLGPERVRAIIAADAAADAVAAAPGDGADPVPRAAAGGR